MTLVSGRPSFGYRRCLLFTPTVYITTLHCCSRTPNSRKHLPSWSPPSRRPSIRKQNRLFDLRTLDLGPLATAVGAGASRPTSWISSEGQSRSKGARIRRRTSPDILPESAAARDVHPQQHNWLQGSTFQIALPAQPPRGVEMPLVGCLTVVSPLFVIPMLVRQ
ncbi:hypothetical protein N431DRAFT_122371 [Stipitochalara longipes BDJ]|nr:hypothetical protein N431DRAFT_122371 [Stipitochalara longipes BDJ]